VVVVTDALGRKSETRVPLYVDYQRLAAGLTDFSVEAGLLRIGYGSRRDRYADRPAASGSLRHGLHDHVTVEAHAEAGHGLRVGGAGLAWSPGGRFGVATVSWAHSGGRRAGHQYSVGYQYFSRRAGFDLYRQRADADYRDLAALGGESATLRAQDRASAWVNVPHGGLTATWLRYRDSTGVESRSVSLGSTWTHGQVSTSLNVFDDRLAGRGVALSVSVAFGERGFATASASRREGRNDVAFGVRRSAPYAGGWGWDAQVRDEGRGQIASHYRGMSGDWVLGLDRAGGSAGSGAFAEASGSVAAMDGRVFTSRRIHDAFAVVSASGMAGVPVLYENRLAGVTDEDGYLLLPELRGWQRNRIAIDPDALPPDIALASTERLVTPADPAGVRASFDLRTLRSASLRMHGIDGEPVAAGSRVTRDDGSQAIVGFDGILWLEEYRDGETLHWGSACIAVTPALADAPGADLPVLTCQDKDTR
jgi:outer membrane usher protein